MSYDMRIFRRKAFKEYHALGVRLGESGQSFNIMSYIADKERLTMEERFWLAWLYSASYSWCTAWYIFTNLPDFTTLKGHSVEAFYEEHREDIIFQTDRKWVKIRNEFVPMFESYKEMVGESQEAFFSLFRHQEPEDNFRALERALLGLHYYGRYGASLFYEAVEELCDMAIAPYPNALDLSQARTVRQGLNLVMGQDAQAEMKALPRAAYGPLQSALTELVEECKAENTDFKETVWGVESSLCPFRNIFKGTRYWGFYTDRIQEELHWNEQHHKDVDWSLGWKARKALVHPSLLGEVNGWKGKRDYMFRVFPQKGRLSLTPIPDIRGRWGLGYKT